MSLVAVSFGSRICAPARIRNAFVLGAVLLAIGCAQAAKAPSDTASGEQDGGMLDPNYPSDPSTSTPATPGAPDTSSSSGTPGSSLPDLSGDGGIGSLFPPAAQSADGGMAAECQNQVCFDVFDCYLWHPDKTSCGFTSCDLGTCK